MAHGDKSPESPRASTQASSEGAQVGTDLGKFIQTKIEEAMGTMHDRTAEITKEFSTGQDIHADEAFKASLASEFIHAGTVRTMSGYTALAGLNSLYANIGTANSQACRNLIEKQGNSPEPQED